MTEPTPATAWPDAESVVFLADARNGLERSLLAEWVRSTDPREGPNDPPELVQVSLQGREASDGGAQLREVLRRPGATCLVPLGVAWLPQRDPKHSGPRLRDLVIGDPRRPRTHVARLLHRQNPDRARCIAGAPATLDDIRGRYQRHAELDPGAGDDLEDFALRQVGIALDIEERKLQGRRYKVPRFVIPSIESGSAYKAAVTRVADSLGRSASDVRAEAHSYLRELVATPSTFFIDWMGTLTRWITSLGYQRVVTDPANIDRARAIVRDRPSALLWTHKSHMDAIALLSVMYDGDFPAPHSIGGINMAFRGVAYTGRHTGTVYIRRSFADNPVYKTALQQYLGYLMEKRFPLSWAFEGTRSRNGKLGPPRYGMLKYVIDAAHVTQTQDLHFVPVSINYDLIGETADYAREEAGQPKEAESLSWFMQYLRRLRAPMGNIYLDFADPVVLEGPAPQATEGLLTRTAFEVARRVNDLVPVTLPSVMCMALLGAAPRALTRPELDKAISALLRWLREREIRLVPTLEQEDIPALESLADNVFSAGIVQVVTEGTETLFEISESQYPVASYYRNTIVHYFVNKAIAEVALARVAECSPEERTEKFWEEARWLRDLTKFEFYHTPSDEFSAALDSELSLHDAQWRESLGGSQGDVIALLTRCAPLVSHAVLLPFLEAYWITARVVAALPAEQPVTEAEVVSGALRLGRSALHRRRIASQASVGKAMFKGAFAYVGDQGLLERGGESVTEARWALAATLNDTIRRIRQIAELAHPELSAEDPS